MYMRVYKQLELTSKLALGLLVYFDDGSKKVNGVEEKKGELNSFFFRHDLHLVLGGRVCMSCPRLQIKSQSLVILRRE